MNGNRTTDIRQGGTTVLTRSTCHRALTALVALGVGAAAAITPAGMAQAAVPHNYLFNNGRNGTGGIGVSHDNSSRKYDAVLPAYENTKDKWGWDHASSFYIGEGDCFDLFSTPSSNPGVWTQVLNDFPAGPGVEVGLDYNYSYQVQPFHC
jgi:hypothetical protein